MNDMRAVVHDRYGGPEVLRVTRLAVPSPGPGEVLVRIAATTVNGGEIAGRQGRVRLVTGRRFPRRVGIDLCGTVVAVGPGTTTDLRPADVVWGALETRASQGSAAEYVTVAVDRVGPAPSNLTPVEAVTLLAGGATSLRALRSEAALQPGERLLVRGASGGVGSVAVQVGRLLGAHVTGTARATSADFVRSLGADDVVDYRTPARELGRFDVVYDTRGTQLREFRRLLGPGGRMVTIAFDLDAPVRSLAYVQASRVHGGRRVRLFFGASSRPLLDDLRAAAERGDLRPVVASTWTLDELPEAHRRLEAGGVLGKVVIDVAVGRRR